LDVSTRAGEGNLSPGILKDGDLKEVGMILEYRRYTLRVSGPKIDGTSVNEYLRWCLLRNTNKKGFPEFEDASGNNPNLNPHEAKYNPDLSIFLR